MIDIFHQIYKIISTYLFTNSPLFINQLQIFIHYIDIEVAVP